MYVFGVLETEFKFVMKHNPIFIRFKLAANMMGPYSKRPSASQGNAM